MGSLSEREAYVAFNLTDKIGSVKLAELVAASGSVVAAWDAYPQKVSRSGAELDWKREFVLAKRYGVEIVTPADPNYPSRLLEQPSHPLALYVKGDASILSSPSVAIVGNMPASLQPRHTRIHRLICHAISSLQKRSRLQGLANTTPQA